MRLQGISPKKRLPKRGVNVLVVELSNNRKQTYTTIGCFNGENYWWLEGRIQSAHTDYIACWYPLPEIVLPMPEFKTMTKFQLVQLATKYKKRYTKAIEDLSNS